MVRALNQSLEVERVGGLAATYAAGLTGASAAACLVPAAGALRVLGTYRATGDSSEADRGGGAPPHPAAAAAIRDAAPAVQAGVVAIPLLVGGRAIGALQMSGLSTSPADTIAALARLEPHVALAVENSRLFSAAARSMRDAAMLALTANELASAPSPGEFYAGLARIAEQSLGASGVGVYLADAESRRVELAHVTGLDPTVAARLPANFWESIAGLAVRTETPIFRPDIRLTSELPDVMLVDGTTLSESHRGSMLATEAELAKNGVRAVAVLPLRVDGRVRGVLSLRFARARSFDDTEQLLLQGFATQVSIALRNANQIADLERRTARLAAVARVQQAIPRLRRDEVYAEIAQAVASVVDVSAVALLGTGRGPRDAVQPLYVAVRGTAATATLHGPGIPLAMLGAVADAYASGHPEIRHHPRWSWTLGGMAGNEPPREQTELAAPIQHGPRLLGVLHLQSDARDAFAADDIELIATIARQAGAAIEMARLFEAQQRERELAEGSADIARAALTNATASTAAAAILHVVQRLVPLAGAALALVDSTAAPDDDPLTPRDSGHATAGPDDTLAYVAATGAASPLEGRRIAARQSLLPGGASSGIPLRRPAGAAEPCLEESFVPAGMELTTIALDAKGRRVGLLLVLTDAAARSTAGEPEPGDNEDDALVRLSAPIALALDALSLGRDERRRRDRERMLATALAALEQPVFLLDPSERVRGMNAAATRVYAASREALLGLTLAELVVSGGTRLAPRGGAPSLTGALRALGAEDAVSSVDLARGDSRTLRAARQEHRRFDGTTFPVELTRAPIRDELGAHVGEVVLVRDLTTEYRIEEHLRQHEKLAALGELVAGVAHELNNPLTGVSAFAQLLLEDELTTDQEESVRLIKREADRAIGVIRDLLLFSRKTGPSVSGIDVNELVRTTVRLRAYHLRTAGVELTLELNEPLPEVNGDMQKLQQVLVNLLVNAEDAVTRSVVRTITVRTAQRDDHVLIDVSDSGYGIAPEIRGHVFEPFYTTKPAGAGTGLGLSVSYGIIEAHGGTLTIAGDPGTGATFRILLPIPAMAPSQEPQ